MVRFCKYGDLAEEMKVSTRTISRWVKRYVSEGRLHIFIKGGVHRVPKEEWDQLMKEQMVGAVKISKEYKAGH